MIGRAGEGSVRDSLSLLDQAIAYGAGTVKTAEVATMLGALDQSYLFSLLERIAGRDAKGLISEIDAIAARAISFDATLKELASTLARIALTQTVGPSITESQDAPQLSMLASKFSTDDLQLVYQIALLGRRDLHLAPDEQSGFTMTLLRAIAFLEAGAGSSGAAISPKGTAPAARPAEAAGNAASAERAAISDATSTAVPASKPGAGEGQSASDLSNWPAFVAGRNLLGMSGMLAKQAEFVAFDGQVLHLRVSEAQKHLSDKKYLEKLKADLSPVLGDSVRINVSVGGVTGASLAAVEDRERNDAQVAAEQSIRNDPFVKSLADEFGASIDRAAIKPVRH
jgi:DNA polymerase-3 subunit gamma/tau